MQTRVLMKFISCPGIIDGAGVGIDKSGFFVWGVDRYDNDGIDLSYSQEIFWECGGEGLFWDR